MRTPIVVVSQVAAEELCHEKNQEAILDDQNRDTWHQQGRINMNNDTEKVEAWKDVLSMSVSTLQ